MHFSDFIWYLNITRDFHFACISHSSKGPKGHTMPPVTHVQAHRLHLPPQIIQGKLSGEMTQCNKLFSVTFLGNVQSWQPELLF